MFFIRINSKLKEYINAIYQLFILIMQRDNRFPFSLNRANFVTLFATILLL